MWEIEVVTIMRTILLFPAVDCVIEHTPTHTKPRCGFYNALLMRHRLPTIPTFVLLALLFEKPHLHESFFFHRQSDV